MLSKNSVNRPDRTLEKVLSALVYTIVALTLSIFMLFVYPQYSLYIILVISKFNKSYFIIAVDY